MKQAHNVRTSLQTKEEILMDIPAHYRDDVARKHAELTQQLHRTAWGDLWAQGIHFHSMELAYHWRSLRNELVTFWEKMDNPAMCESIGMDMDNLMKQDEALA